MSVFFIADMHFGDAAIFRYENRPFASVERIRYAPIAFTQIKQTIKEAAAHAQ